MKQSTSAQRIQQMLSSGRQERLDMHRILSLLPLRPYLTVADIGCGPGFFTIPLAKTLWDGKVYAVDVDEEMLEAVRQRAQEARLGNIVTMKSEEAALPLEPGSVDGALLACVLHEVSNRAKFLKAVAETLRKGGWCGIIEWRTTAEGEEVPPLKRRIAREEMERMASKAGLRVTLRRELNSYHYMLLLNK